MSKTIPIVNATAPAGVSTAIEGDGMGCHAGGDLLAAVQLALHELVNWQLRGRGAEPLDTCNIRH